MLVVEDRDGKLRYKADRDGRLSRKTGSNGRQRWETEI